MEAKVRLWAAIQQRCVFSHRSDPLRAAWLQRTAEASSWMQCLCCDSCFRRFIKQTSLALSLFLSLPLGPGGQKPALHDCSLNTLYTEQSASFVNLALEANEQATHPKVHAGVAEGGACVFRRGGHSPVFRIVDGKAATHTHTHARLTQKWTSPSLQRDMGFQGPAPPSRPLRSIQT